MVDQIADIHIGIDTEYHIQLASYFTDPDGDTLRFEATSSRPEVAAFALSGSSLSIRSWAAGSSDFRVTAYDPSNLSDQMSFAVFVEGDDPAGGGPCRIAMELGPGESCTVDIPFITGTSNVFEVKADGSACWGGGFCATTGGLNLNGFEANRIQGTDRWRIDGLP